MPRFPYARPSPATDTRCRGCSRRTSHSPASKSTRRLPPPWRRAPALPRPASRQLQQAAVVSPTRASVQPSASRPCGCQRPHYPVCPAFQALNWQSLEQQVAVLHRAHTCGFCSATAACSSLRTAWFAFGQPNANHPSQASQGRRSCRRWSRDGRLWDRIVPHVHLGLPSARRGCGAAQVFICTSCTK